MRQLTLFQPTGNEVLFSYQPMPFYDDYPTSQTTFNKKLDLNLYCIKHPTQTCFIRVTNPNLLAWGIELGDMLVVEKQDSLSIGDLVVIRHDDKMEIYEFVGNENGQFVFFALNSKMSNIKTALWQELPIVGTVTNSIHQMKPKNNLRFAA